MSNMLGGLGYFHGKSVVDRALDGYETDVPIDFFDTLQNNAEIAGDYFSDEDEDEEEVSVRKPNPMPEGPTSLFTGVPSRPFFPRGFLWYIQYYTGIPVSTSIF